MIFGACDWLMGCRNTRAMSRRKGVISLAPSRAARAPCTIPANIAVWDWSAGTAGACPTTVRDCVVYHEGLGHTLGLPHPDPMNDSVMGTAQYVYALNETWLDKDQKQQMGWHPPRNPTDLDDDLFSKFSAKYQPASPVIGQEVVVRFTWPKNAQVDRLTVAVQTDLFGAWHQLPNPVPNLPPDSISLGSFTEPTPVSYRVRVQLRNGQNTEIWSYFQGQPGSARVLVQRLQIRSTTQADLVARAQWTMV